MAHYRGVRISIVQYPALRPGLDSTCTQPSARAPEPPAPPPPLWPSRLDDEDEDEDEDEDGSDSCMTERAASVREVERGQCS